MSGFEILGVVLGTIPLVISALEHYQEGLHTIRRWHSYEAELQSLKRKLANENAIFINTCEQLLVGIVGSVDHEKLINEPFGELWKSPEINDEIALRLDHVFRPFGETVAAIEADLREIKTKLGLDEQFKVSFSIHACFPVAHPVPEYVSGLNQSISWNENRFNELPFLRILSHPVLGTVNYERREEANFKQAKWTEGKAIVREIKRASLTIKRSQFDGLLDSISKSNQYLKTLTNQSIQLEPERRVKSHGRLFSQLNEVSRSVYRAIRNSLLCGCPGSHRVSLRLRKPKLMPRDEEAQVLHNSNFQCAVSYHRGTKHATEEDDAWSLMMLQIYEPPPKQSETEPPNTPSHQNGPSLSSIHLVPPAQQVTKVKKRQTVKFLDGDMSNCETKQPQYALKTIIATSHPMTTIGTAFADLHMGTLSFTQEQPLADPLDLCHLIQKGKKGQRCGCFGLISDSTSERYPKFGVHPFPEQNDNTSMISLRKILEDGEMNFPCLSYEEGLRLAIDISSGVLQLLKTSWLPERITSRDIFFLMEDGCPMYSKVFVAKKISDSDQQPPNRSKAMHMQIVKRTMFSLGLLLLELLFFEILDHVWDLKTSTSTPKAMSQFSDWKSATDLLNRVQMVGSPKFYSAVHRFLFCEFTCSDLKMSDSFYKEVYGKTIALLEEDYKSTVSPW